MSGIETLIILLLVFMVVPDICLRAGRPGLTYAVFVMLGVAVGPMVSAQVKTMLHEIGHVGFLLLLFEVGLDVELPGLRDVLRSLRFAMPWAMAQYLLVMGIGTVAGMDTGVAMVAGSALAACSVGMAYPAWKTFPGLEEEVKRRVLHVMITLEVLSIIVLAVGTTALSTGWDWRVLASLGGMVVVITLTSFFSRQITWLFQFVLGRTTHWRVHLLIVLVLAIAAIGNRLGLSAAKTAFFLGLFMAHVEHDGQRLEDYLAPVTQRLLIPICFVALGLRIDWSELVSWTSLTAAATAIALLAWRAGLCRSWLKLCAQPRAGLLLSPNLTLVALAATSLLGDSRTEHVAPWLLLSGLFVTVPALVLLPRARS